MRFLLFRIFGGNDVERLTIGHLNLAVFVIRLAVVVLVAAEHFVHDVGAHFISATIRQVAGIVCAVGVHGGFQQLNLRLRRRLHGAGLDVGRGLPHAGGQEAPERPPR